MEANSSLEAKAIMLTLVQIKNSRSSSAENASLVADYMAFDRRRTERRQYQKAFGGLGIIVLIGALFGRVPADQAAIIAGLLIAPPVALAIVEVVHWRRLVRRLEQARLEARSVRKS
jgi:hypothetical protein